MIDQHEKLSTVMLCYSEQQFIRALRREPERRNIQVCLIKFIHSEKATKFCEISTVDLSYVVPVKFTVEISQNFVAFSECMNFKVVAIAHILQPLHSVGP